MAKANCNHLLGSYSMNPVAAERGEHGTTQSAVPPFDFHGEEFSYTSSPASQGTEGTETVLTPNSDQPPFLSRVEIASYQFPFQPMSRNSYTPSLQGSYTETSPSDEFKPPLDVVDNLAHTGSPTVTAPGFPSAVAASSTVASPANWPTPEPAYPQFTWDQPTAINNRGTSRPTPSFSDHYSRQIGGPSYSSYSGFHPHEPIETDSSGHSIPVAETSPISLPQVDLSPDLSREPDENKEIRDAIKAPAEQLEGDDGAKASEPYARLIYRAFMSRESHAMTLQEIYQWFRENTDKANNESKGWQNSIRHNLSMNGAFVKRERNSTGAGEAAPEPQDSKKSTEWVLQDWAVRDGVQSTTRYRKGNPSRRGGAAANLRSLGNGSTRSSGVRKSGVSSRAKSIARRPMLSRSVAHGLLHGLHEDFPSYGQAQAMFQRPLSYAYSHSAHMVDDGSKQPSQATAWGPVVSHNQGTASAISNNGMNQLGMHNSSMQSASMHNTSPLMPNTSLAHSAAMMNYHPMHTSHLHSPHMHTIPMNPSAMHHQGMTGMHRPQQSQYTMGVMGGGHIAARPALPTSYYGPYLPPNGEVEEREHVWDTDDRSYE